MRNYLIPLLLIGSFPLVAAQAPKPTTHVIPLDSHNFTLPVGFTIERVAGPPLVDGLVAQFRCYGPMSSEPCAHVSHYFRRSDGCARRAARLPVEASYLIRKNCALHRAASRQFHFEGIALYLTRNRAQQSEIGPPVVRRQ